MADSNQPADSKRPDLEESINVAEAHASLIEGGIAQAREKRIKETGMEPISLWVILASAIVLLVGGSVIGAGGKLLAYSPHPQGYIRADFPTGGNDGPTSGPIYDALYKRGQKLFAKCSGCHGSTGEGNAGFPPLAGSEWVQGNTERFAMIVLNGLKDPITVKGNTFNGSMPSQAPLTATELAALMTFVRNNFGNAVGDIVTPEQAAAALEIQKSRPAGQQITADELNATHDKMLEGDSMDPTTVVDFETLEPVEDPPGAK
jgi:mono/diheme cytochrome c family protein